MADVIEAAEEPPEEEEDTDYDAQYDSDAEAAEAALGTGGSPLQPRTAPEREVATIRRALMQRSANTAKGYRTAWLRYTVRRPCVRQLDY